MIRFKYALIDKRKPTRGGLDGVYYESRTSIPAYPGFNSTRLHRS